jgi:hypothetical protein
LRFPLSFRSRLQNPPWRHGKTGGSTFQWIGLLGKIDRKPWFEDVLSIKHELWLKTLSEIKKNQMILRMGQQKKTAETRRGVGQNLFLGHGFEYLKCSFFFFIGYGFL